MILIADSGSTKTTWYLSGEAGIPSREVQTPGINPYYQEEAEILALLRKEWPSAPAPLEALFFYGAGCAHPEVNEKVRRPLMRWSGCRRVEVGSDLLAAARALCGHAPGIACILGTGSNSCYYDGREIAGHVSPLGFILGDEGSGAVIGRQLLADVLKNQLPSRLIRLFFETYSTSREEILENIYRKPFPNRYAASFTRFIYDHREEPALKNIAIQEFIRFFERNVRQYDQAGHLPVHFCGSIAFYFRELLTAVTGALGMETGKIIREPIGELAAYHLQVGMTKDPGGGEGQNPA